jgi:hypothetical protein
MRFNERQRSLTMSIAGGVATVGLALVVRGVFLAWRPGGWILAGIFVAVPSVFVAYAAFREK